MEDLLDVYCVAYISTYTVSHVTTVRICTIGCNFSELGFDFDGNWIFEFLGIHQSDLNCKYVLGIRYAKDVHRSVFMRYSTPLGSLKMIQYFIKNYREESFFVGEN